MKTILAAHCRYKFIRENSTDALDNLADIAYWLLSNVQRLRNVEGAYGVVDKTRQTRLLAELQHDLEDALEDLAALRGFWGLE